MVSRSNHTPCTFSVRAPPSPILRPALARPPALFYFVYVQGSTLIKSRAAALPRRYVRSVVLQIRFTDKRMKKKRNEKLDYASRMSKAFVAAEICVMGEISRVVNTDIVHWKMAGKNKECVVKALTGFCETS